jgi:bifunctional non-homologous end joining protein LigD
MGRLFRFLAQQERRTLMEHITLYYQQGSSDKVYQASITPQDGGFIVHFAFGRRRTRLQTGSKTPAPVEYDQAKRIFDKLVAEKMAKGYTPGEDGAPYTGSTTADRVSGILPQLLNPVAEEDVSKLLQDPQWWLQEKFDGQRMLIRRSGNEVVGINRRGLEVALPETIRTEARACGADFIVDGESMGDEIVLFDLLKLGDHDLRPLPYLERFLSLMQLCTMCEGRYIRHVTNCCTDQEKRRAYQELKVAAAEGVVFKKITEPYTPGRPASGGAALKYKFVETASFMVGRVNSKRSVALQLLTDGEWADVGNVTIPLNERIPEAGDVVECRYLYAFPGGAVYQPVYRGIRDDISREECMLQQLKLKPDTARKAA